MTAFIAITLIVLLGVVMLVLLSGIALYARLMRLRSVVNSARLEIDNVLRKRNASETGTPLRGLEDHVTAAVRDYNSAVKNYNLAIGTFPAGIIAKLFTIEKTTLSEIKPF